MRVTVLAGVAAIMSAVASQGAVIYSENFDDVAALITSGGWANINLSNPVGAETWAQGNTSNFTAADTTDGYAGVGVLSTNPLALSGVISNWLVTSVLTVNNGYTVSFFSRTVTVPLFPDRLELRWSSSGASTNVGATETSVGDFINLLLVVNDSLSPTGYPSDWTQFTATFTGLAGPSTGRLAFRYNVFDTSLQADYIGVDTLTVSDVDVVPSPVPEPSAFWTMTAGAAVLAFLRHARGASARRKRHEL